MNSKQIEFSMAVLCYQSQEGIIPFIERLHKIMSMFLFEWEIILVANYWEGAGDRTPEIVQHLCERLLHTRYVAKPKEGNMGWDMKMV